MSIAKIGYVVAISMLLLPLSASAYPFSKTVEVVATGYAPLDPKAVKGVCYSGDPYVTASGRKTTPGITIAAAKRIPFGTWVWLEGFGWRRVDDRGKKITKGRIDICFHTRKEAIEWGKRKVRMYIYPHRFSEREVKYIKEIKRIVKKTMGGKE